MANFSVNKWTGATSNSIEDALTLLETKLEAIDSAKTIRLIGVATLGDGKYFQPYLIYDA